MSIATVTVQSSRVIVSRGMRRQIARLHCLQQQSWPAIRKRRLQILRWLGLSLATQRDKAEFLSKHGLHASMSYDDIADSFAFAFLRKYPIEA